VHGRKHFAEIQPEVTWAVRGVFPGGREHSLEGSRKRTVGGE